MHKPFRAAGASLCALLLSPIAALAHGGEDITDATAWHTWNLTPDIIIASALLMLVYGAGMARRAGSGRPPKPWRHALFFSGVLSIFLALQSPVDPIAERLFSVHQIQHFLLRMLGPMLIALSFPQGILIAGLPRSVRRALLVRPLSNSTVRGLLGPLAHPVTVTALFVVSLYFWEVPYFHNAALLNEGVHYTMHVTMLAAGLLFWWRIFDARPEPKGLRYGVRLMMVWLGMLSAIALGSYTTLKDTVLYTAYDLDGRLFGMSAVNDEHLGGLIIWVPSAMMCLVAVIFILHLMGLREERLEQQRLRWTPSNSAAMAYPTTGAQLVAAARPKNRMMAMGFGVFACAVFATSILFGILDVHMGHAQMRQNGVPESAWFAPAREHHG